MKKKFIALLVMLLSISVLGVVQLQSQAAGHPNGKVGNAPVCDVKAIGVRGDTSVDLATPAASALAFKLNGNTASVSFNVTGPKNCKVLLSARSFWAAAQNGKPYNTQVLYSNTTKIFGRGTHSLAVNVPTTARNTMCYYQVDLTYGKYVVTPTLAYAHGMVNSCKPPVPPTPQPVAKCDSLAVDKLSSTSFKLTANTTVKDGAQVTSYRFVIKKSGQVVLDKTQNENTLTTEQTVAGEYAAQVYVNTNVGTFECANSFTVDKEKVPGIDIEKYVNGMKQDSVAVDTPFSYTLKVKNTGETDLSNVVVTDVAPDNIQFISTNKGEIENNSLQYTIAKLTVGQSDEITIQAKATRNKANGAVNEACVNAPEVNPSDPTKPDDCDTAVIEIPSGVNVCDPDTGKIIDVPKDQEDKYLPADSDKCKDKVVVCDPETGKVVTVIEGQEGKYLPADNDKCKEKEKAVATVELPKTGPAEIAVQIVGAMSLAGASSYYMASRRS